MLAGLFLPRLRLLLCAGLDSGVSPPAPDLEVATAPATRLGGGERWRGPAVAARFPPPESPTLEATRGRAAEHACHSAAHILCARARWLPLPDECAPVF